MTEEREPYKLTGRGGPGRGQGRKLDPNRKISYSTRLPRWLVKWLKEQDNAAKVIEESLIERNKLKPE